MEQAQAYKEAHHQQACRHPRARLVPRGCPINEGPYNEEMSSRSPLTLASSRILGALARAVLGPPQFGHERLD